MVKFPPHTQWDVFCKVIDNYGDIGVCWRLARQLANEQQQYVRLWVDDLKAFKEICPHVNTNLNKQLVENIFIYHWQAHWQPVSPADIVIESFACNLPDDYIQAMSQANKTILWVNLEYLTYERWSVDFHAIPSLQSLNLKKYFFFPGLPETGGLIREHAIIEQAITFQNDPIAQQQFLSQLHVTKKPNSFLLFIFSYANQAIGEWLDTLKHGEHAYQLLIPQTPLLKNLADYLHIDVNTLIPDYTVQLKNLTLQIIPFITQVDFDKLLWCTDYNIIRGEDSFIRAQYAGKPMLWHIYPQREKTHLMKLEAFLEHYLDGLPSSVQLIIKNWWFAWNNQENLAESWLAYCEQISIIKEQAKKWTEKQKTVTDLITKLAKLYKN
ncbi:elongation factor P maturation arginine rhamnosyltransferase EarP [Entomomonas moraniae]|uniref:Protein-arginine rhamnosyltransferase n=1 Tax=Entomomonas moraniae TaxID=2213226 RepID=A0A3S9XER3_9GAMM|nr:elongation factor P maturation arginine rhamnosyltransferase EarP [Entomomonas moraniae]AZS50891.1 elongation factor P maturation arginine rhamnosyltransferase EarP [Entomomonas moraniae]